jgi:3-hydroxyacyl-[acyl-carrier-protein] dehydratase
MTMTFEEIKTYLKQRFPFIMVDRVLELDPGKRIKALKNVTGNEIQFLGHFPEYAIMPGVFIVESIGQCASILFSRTTSQDRNPGEVLVLGAINDMRFFVPVLPGHTMVLEVSILKMLADAALVEGIVTVDSTVVAKGKLSFARKSIGLGPTETPAEEPARR